MSKAIYKTKDFELANTGCDSDLNIRLYISEERQAVCFNVSMSNAAFTTDMQIKLTEVRKIAELFASFADELEAE